MYEVSIDTSFSAAHRLCGYPGICKKMHGHNWVAKVYVRSVELDALGLVVDFHWLKETTDTILAQIDHSILNEHPAFRDSNPTSENISIWLYGELKKEFEGKPFWLHAIEVYETEHSSARYEGSV